MKKKRAPASRLRQIKAEWNEGYSSWEIEVGKEAPFTVKYLTNTPPHYIFIPPSRLNCAFYSLGGNLMPPRGAQLAILPAPPRYPTSTHFLILLNRFSPTQNAFRAKRSY